MVLSIGKSSAMKLSLTFRSFYHLWLFTLFPFCLKWHATPLLKQGHLKQVAQEHVWFLLSYGVLLSSTLFRTISPTKLGTFKLVNASITVKENILTPYLKITIKSVIVFFTGRSILSTLKALFYYNASICFYKERNIQLWFIFHVKKQNKQKIIPKTTACIQAFWLYFYKKQTR